MKNSDDIVTISKHVSVWSSRVISVTAVSHHVSQYTCDIFFATSKLPII